MKPTKQKYFFRTLPRDYGTYDLTFVDNDGNEIATAKKGDDKSKPFTISPLFPVSDSDTVHTSKTLQGCYAIVEDLLQKNGFPNAYYH